MAELKNEKTYRIIKRITAQNLPACLDLIHRSFATVAGEFGLTVQNCPSNGAFIPPERLQNDYNKGHAMFGLYACGRLAGFMQLEKKDENVYILEKLAVLPENRHRGYGKELIEFAVWKVRKSGGSKISIGIIEENRRLKEWYKANGFTHTGTKVFPHLPFTVGFMEKEI